MVREEPVSTQPLVRAAWVVDIGMAGPPHRPDCYFIDKGIAEAVAKAKQASERGLSITVYHVRKTQIVTIGDDVYELAGKVRIDDETTEAKRAVALAKLTPEELVVLGVG